jgi:hypothetical protein
MPGPCPFCVLDAFNNQPLKMTRYSGNQIFNALAEGDHPTITDTAIFIPAEEVALLSKAITEAYHTLLVPAAEYVPAIGDALDILKKAGAKK